MIPSLIDKILERSAGICLYGLAPPKRTTTSQQLDEIVSRQLERLRLLPIDGLIIYDLQDEAERIAEPRPFPFLPTIDPEVYAHDSLDGLRVPKVVYRCINRDTPGSLTRYLERQQAAATPRLAVLVGAPSRRSTTGLSLASAYALARGHAPDMLLGGVAIAERHAKNGREHERMLAKTEQGCRFFVTQAVYDVGSTQRLISDYAIAARRKGNAPLPVILTFSPCGSVKTLTFMKWLGIAFPEQLENALLASEDPLAMSLDICEHVFADVWDHGREMGVPIGINVESVSIRRSEIEASVDLLMRLRRRMGA